MAERFPGDDSPTKRQASQMQPKSRPPRPPATSAGTAPPPAADPARFWDGPPEGLVQAFTTGPKPASISLPPAPVSVAGHNLADWLMPAMQAIATAASARLGTPPPATQAAPGLMTPVSDKKGSAGLIAPASDKPVGSPPAPGGRPRAGLMAPAGRPTAGPMTPAGQSLPSRPPTAAMPRTARPHPAPAAGSVWLPAVNFRSMDWQSLAYYCQKHLPETADEAALQRLAKAAREQRTREAANRLRDELHRWLKTLQLIMLQARGSDNSAAQMKLNQARRWLAVLDWVIERG